MLSFLVKFFGVIGVAFLFTWIVNKIGFGSKVLYTFSGGTTITVAILVFLVTLLYLGYKVAVKVE
jgi:hypothetical protein